MGSMSRRRSAPSHKKMCPSWVTLFGKGKLRIGPVKVKAIFEWEQPTKVTGLRLFIGLVNYYRQFIRGYFAIAAPLTDLLKKGRGWI